MIRLFTHIGIYVLYSTNSNVIWILPYVGSCLSGVVMEFNQNFITIQGDTLTLNLIKTCVGDDKVIPFYYYDIF